jgi:hypothetical protein
VSFIIPRLNGYNRFRETSLGILHISFALTIFADGSSPDTLIIYPTKKLPSEVPLEELATQENFKVTGNPGGWMTNGDF